MVGRIGNSTAWNLRPIRSSRSLNKKWVLVCTHFLISICISLSGCERGSGHSPSMLVTTHTSSGGSRAMWSFSFKVLLVLLAVVAALWLTLSRVASTKEALADRELLERLWQHYKKHYVDDAGFVLDHQQQRITSEGQSYALLRAAWMRDRATFDRVLAWTEAHLKRPDGLSSWLFSPTAQHLLDANTATDADQDIAYALVIAAQAFKAPRYLERAREIVKAVRTVASITWSEHGQHRWFPTAGNWATTERLVNLSYFLPYAYPEFNKLDPEGQWLPAGDGRLLLPGRPSSPPGGGARAG